MIPVTSIHIARLMRQVEQNLSGLHRDMHNNAKTWKAQAQAQSLPVVDLSARMASSADGYLKRLDWHVNAASQPHWPRVAEMWSKVGGSQECIDCVIEPMRAAANALKAADLSNYEAILKACDAQLAAVDAPPSLWEE